MAGGLLPLVVSATAVAAACCLPAAAGAAGEDWKEGPATGRGLEDEDVEAWMETGSDDATWVLTSAFVILTMQSGFGALESGSVDQRFQVNVMMKNVIDVVFGGVSYWMVGYGISYGKSFNGLTGTTGFLINMSPSINEMASSGQSFEFYSHYIFQFTFASTATTIVSGCVAGRMKFHVYVLFSFVNTVIYSFTCHWVWSEEGWLNRLGFVDFAGDGPVHLMGGINGLVAAWCVGPRAGRWDPERKGEFGLKNPLNCVMGLFMLWWGWLGFNCGSTFGISSIKWLVASRIAVTTINASIGGGLFGVAFSFWMHRGIVVVESVVNGILSGLVAITAGCAAMTPIEALLVGLLGAAAAEATNAGLARYRLLDDPVGAVGVHGTSSLWGLLSVGLFAQSQLMGGPDRDGLFHGGGVGLLGTQALGVGAIGGWTLVTSHAVFFVLDRFIGLRASALHEELGFDVAEHGLIAEPSTEAAVMRRRVEELTAQMSSMLLTVGTLQAELQALQKERGGDGACPKRPDIICPVSQRVSV